MDQKWKKIGILIVFALIIFWVYSSIDLGTFSPLTFQKWILSFGILSGILFILVYALGPVVLIPASILSLAAGALFGKGLGTLYVIIGANIAANISFIIARYFGDSVQKGIAKGKGKVIKEINETIAQNGFLTVLYLRLIPVFPYTFLNYALGLTKISHYQYFLGTLLGMIPGIFAYVYLGESVTNIGGKEFWIALTFFIFMAVVPACVKKIYGDKLFKKKNEDDTVAKKTYDIIVVGAGSGGLNIAVFMNRVGFKVLLIDKSDKSIGGDCLNSGCVPSKALLHIAKMVKQGKSMEEFGSKNSGKISLEKVMKYVFDKQEIFRDHESKAWFVKLGMDVVLGEAKFSGKNKIIVNKNEYASKKILLATGSRPRRMNALKSTSSVKVVTNEEIFSLKKLPDHLVVIGGGPIGMELGQAFLRLGSKVTVVHRGNEILKKEDPSVAKIVQKQLEKEGMKFVFGYSPIEIQNDSLIIGSKEKNKKKISCDHVLVAAGRELNLDLDLEIANISTENGKLVLDNYLRTTNKNVFVAGDIANGPMFTHAAEVHASFLIRNFFSPIKTAVNYDSFAWVTYTDPEIATFGQQEHTLVKRNISYEVVELNHEEDDRTIVESGNGLSKVFVSKKGLILGGTMVSKNAGELIQEFVLAMQMKIPVSNFLNKVYPYPVHSRVNKRLVGNYMGRKLTPLAMKIMRFLY